MKQPLQIHLVSGRAPRWGASPDLAVHRMTDDLPGEALFEGPAVVVLDAEELLALEPGWLASVRELFGVVVVLSDGPVAAEVAQEAEVLPRSFLDAAPDLAGAVLRGFVEPRPSGAELERYMRDAIHEFRTPLTTVIEFASLLADEIGGPVNERQRAYLEYVLSASDRMVEMFDDYRDGLRLHLATLGQRPAWTPSVEILEQAAARCSDTTIEVDGGAAHVWADGALMTTAVRRLIDAAHKLGAADRPVALTAERRGDRHCIDVVFEGLPPSDEDQRILVEGVVERDGYYRSLTRVFGLGVALASRLVTAAGGDLRLHADAEGGRFRLRLPAGVEGPALLQEVA